MFSQKDFITASRKFVCVRLESYESLEHQKIVRSFLGGRFENTAFCLLAPDGEERLSRSGRAPWMAFGRRGPRGDSKANNQATITAMEKVASDYKSKGTNGFPIAQDFHSFRQALNVASGDQRLLVFVAAPKSERESLRKTLRPVLGDDKIIGRFHADFIGESGDEKWHEAVKGKGGESGIFIIQADKFGQEGKVLASLKLDAKPAEIKTALLSANETFAKAETPQSLQQPRQRGTP